MNFQTNINKERQLKKKWDRREKTAHVSNFDKQNNTSQREYARTNNVPRSTLQNWLKNKKSIDASPELILFFESPAGLAFLHKLISALHFSFTKVGNASIHNICDFLQLSGLSSFVASSYGSHQKISTQIDGIINTFGESEKVRLAKGMKPKKITLCQDETFHPDICLVAMEAVSNYILVEEYSQKRDSLSWSNVVDKGIQDLSVEIVQSTGDEAKALINYAEEKLGVNHSPDIFHVSNEIIKGTSGALASKVKQAQKAGESASKHLTQCQQEKKDYESIKQGPGRPPDFEKKIEQAQSTLRISEKMSEKAIQNQANVKQSYKQIGIDYHPYNLKTGQVQDSKKVGELLDKIFDTIKQNTQHLSERCTKHIYKAYRVVNKLKNTIAYFFIMTQLLIDNLELDAKNRELVEQYLIPGFYLSLVAAKQKDKESKIKIENKSEELLSLFYDTYNSINPPDNQRLEEIEKTSQECAYLFQRSSSNVEGRNAQLSLKHHNLHRLKDERLKALTNIHNYWIKNKDDTTAAQRFFDKKPKNMFEYILDNLDMPARPRNKYGHIAA